MLRFKLFFVAGLLLLLMISCEKGWPDPPWGWMSRPGFGWLHHEIVDDSTIRISFVIRNLDIVNETQQINEIGLAWDTGFYDITRLTPDITFSALDNKLILYSEGESLGDSLAFSQEMICRYYTDYIFFPYVRVNGANVLYGSIYDYDHPLRHPVFSSNYVSISGTSLWIYCELSNLYQTSLTHSLTQTGYCWQTGRTIPDIEDNVRTEPHNGGPREYWDDDEGIGVSVGLEPGIIYTFRPYAILDYTTVFYGDTISVSTN